MNESWVAPVITGIFALLVGVVGGVLARRGARLSHREQRAPSVQEMWAQQEEDRQMRILMEDRWWRLWRAFQSFYRRVQAAVVRLSIPEEHRKEFDLTEKEREAVNLRPPDEGG